MKRATLSAFALSGSMPALATLICLPFFPALAARLNTAGGMSLGYVLVGLSLLLMPILQLPEAWLVLRFIMGAGLVLTSETGPNSE